jgi:oligopeptide/dipeptide ABC transporter ATP-binding protein
MSPRPDPLALLSIRDLVVEFDTPAGPRRAVDAVSFDLYPDEVLGVVGESGSGKSVSMLAVMGLLPVGGGRVTGGEIWFKGGDLRRMPEAQLRALRGAELAMVFQDPMTSLNPVRRVGVQIAEAIRLHQRGLSRTELRQRAIRLLEVVGVPDPRRCYRQYPHEFSGGMRQRAMIAMAIANEPSVLIADEPTTALDVTIEAQILDLILGIQAETEMALILITHDLNVIGEIARNVIVMYLGKVVEQATVDQIFDDPKHPYTQGLLQSLPQIGRGARLTPIAGTVPGPHERMAGCSFAPRCPHVMEQCLQAEPPLLPTSDGSHTACWLYESVRPEAREVTHG